MLKFRRNIAAVAAIALSLIVLPALRAPARAADPIKVGFSMALTGAVAQNGKQLIIALGLWRDDVNAKGGLLGRPVELVYYDDQSNPSNVPGIYTKLITVDKVDLLLGPYATNMAAPAVPVIMEHNMMTISMLAINVNRHFNYARYFDMIPVGPEGTKAFSRGFFELAAAQTPKPQTVAIIAADAEFSKTSADGARENAAANGFKIVYDQSYPPSTTDFTPVMRAVQAANADVVFVAAYPPDTVGIVRAAQEIGLKPKMFGGTMIGLLITPIKMQLGPLLDGIVIMESFVLAPTLQFSRHGRRAQALSGESRGRKDRSDRLRLRAVRLCRRPGRWRRRSRAPKASITRSSPTICTATPSTPWSATSLTTNPASGRSRATLFTQFQNVAAGNSISSATAASSRYCGRRNTRPAP